MFLLRVLTNRPSRIDFYIGLAVIAVILAVIEADLRSIRQVNHDTLISTEVIQDHISCGTPGDPCYIKPLN